MPPNELRIGCFVKLRDTGKIVRVSGLLPKSVQYCKDLGGESDYRYCRYVDIDGVLIYDHWHNLDYETLWHGDTREDSMYSLPFIGIEYKFRYIHELQNIHFALTGDELKIDL